MAEIPCGFCGKNVSSQVQWANVGGVPYCLSCVSIARIWQDDWKGCPICGAPATGFGQGFEIAESSFLGGRFSCKSCQAEWKVVSDFRVLKTKGLLGLQSKDDVYVKIDAELTGKGSGGRGVLGERRAVEWVIAKDNKPVGVKKWTDLPPDIAAKLASPSSS